MKGFLGLDIGSTTVKAVLIDHKHNDLIKPIYLRSLGRPLEAFKHAIQSIRRTFDGEVMVGITGSGREIIKDALDLPEDALLTEIYAHSYGAWHLFPGVRTIVDIGGQDNKLIYLQPGENGSFSINDFIMNELCAAGTGAFLEMHAKELGFESVEEFGQMAARSPRPSKIAGRCSVLAQSDVVHLRQGGEDLDNIAAGLCRAVVLNVLSMAGGKPLNAPILFQGGVASNAGVVRALRTELGLDEKQVIVPKYHKTIGALGAALYVVKRQPAGAATYRVQDILRTIDRKTNTGIPLPKAVLAPLLRKKPVQNCDSNSFIKPASGYKDTSRVVLGFDVGSASVKIAALNPRGDCIFAYYALHDGKPIDVLYLGLEKMQKELRGNTVEAVAVTGSGRDNVELRVGADINVDEITAQAEGATMLDPDVEAIFEIGGQDSKFIQLRNGQVYDFEMNRICAAGTGAFVMEASKILGVEPGEGLDALAFESLHPVVISNRCCVFAKSDMVSLLNSGVSQADVAGGIVYAIIKNYLNLVVGNREVGKKVVFLGGLAKTSQAILSALMSLMPDIEITVPEMCEVSGALGAARIAWQEFQNKDIRKSRFRGIDSSAVNFPVSEFDCKGCSNLCRIKKWHTFDNEVAYTGSICGRYEGTSKKQITGRDFVQEDLELLRSYEEGKADVSDRVIGVPRALLYYEQGPLWISFLRKLGFQVVVSDAGRAAIKSGGLRSPIGMVCLPIKVLLGQVEDLAQKGIKKVFFPTVVEMQRPGNAFRSDNCMLIQVALDSYLKPSFPQMEFISPVFHYEGRQSLWRKALQNAAERLGFDKKVALEAVRLAEIVQKDFLEKRKVLGQEFMKEVETGKPCVVLMGHEYSSAPELDMGISRHLSKLGATVAPLALLLPFAENEPLGQEHFDLIFKSSQNLILGTRYIMKQKPNLFPVVLNQFLCRQDACVIPFLSKLLAGRPSLRITLDENVGVAGLKTRCTAFWHVMKNQVVFSPDSKTISDPFYSFVPDRRLKRFDGVVWMIGMLRFYAAGYRAIGINVKFFSEESRDAIDRGRKYFPDGEPCLPFIREAGLLEKLAKNPEFDPNRDLIHVPGTRHCASTTLPHLYKRVFEKLGLSEVKFISPRDGLDTAEAVETFGTTYVQNITRALFGEEYLKKMLLAIRPYEVNRGEADTVFRSCMEQFHSSFGTGNSYFKTLRAIIDRMAAVKTNEERGSRPKVLITGEYVVRTDPFLNDDIHRKIETLGGEAIRTPLFADYVELAGRRRYRTLWKLKQRSKALREFVLTRFLLRDIHKIRAAFAPHIPDQIEPNPVDSLKDCSHYMNQQLDPVMLLEFYQAFWNMKRGDIAGIVNVHPFGCSISTAVEPMLHEVYGKQVPVLSLSFDGQANVHMNNRLAAFMECVHDRS